MNIKRIVWPVIWSVAIILLMILWSNEKYMIFSIAIVLVSSLLFYLKFEKRNTKPEEIVLIAALAAIAVIGRIPFAAIASVQATSFVIIVSAIVFGKKRDFDWKYSCNRV